MCSHKPDLRHTWGLGVLLPPSLCLSLGPLVGKVKEYQVETIVDTLCANMRSDKEQLRDIAGIGLKTILSELPPTTTGTRCSTQLCYWGQGILLWEAHTYVHSVPSACLYFSSPSAYTYMKYQ